MMLWFTQVVRYDELTPYIGVPMYGWTIHRNTSHKLDGPYIGAPLFEHAFHLMVTIKRSPFIYWWICTLEMVIFPPTKKKNLNSTATFLECQEFLFWDGKDSDSRLNWLEWPKSMLNSRKNGSDTSCVNPIRLASLIKSNTVIVLYKCSSISRDISLLVFYTETSKSNN